MRAAAASAFQFTLPHGERLTERDGADKRARFNSRSRMGSDCVRAPCRPVCGVSIHAPAWGATRRLDLSTILARVSIHAPAWGATISAGVLPGSSTFQFTLPHGERRGRNVTFAQYGAFQFTLPHGERRDLRREADDAAGFNSRSRMGSDTGTRRGLAHCRRFNSRSRMGSDYEARSYRSNASLFQFTLPHGERLDLGRHLSGIFRFNSRSRMGSDLGPRRGRGRRAQVSIHAPAWGATSAPRSDRGCAAVSIHAPAWGATPPRGQPPFSLFLFQFTLPHGERPNETDQNRPGRGFNSRSRMGSDHRHPPHTGGRKVSIHAPAWGATARAKAADAWDKFQFTLPHGERQAQPRL